MPTCAKCNSHFKVNILIDGKMKNLGSRKYCLTCSPFGRHNTKKIHLPNVYVIDRTKPRLCTRCNEIKQPEEFYKKGGIPFSSFYCKRCTIDQAGVRARETKRIAVEYKGGKCMVCGYDRYIGALQFHHPDPTVKDYAICQKKTVCFEQIKAELDKCVLVCSRCHSEIEGGIIPCPGLDSQAIQTLPIVAPWCNR